MHYLSKDVLLKQKATLRDFILHEMASRGLSGIAFAKLVGVSAATINTHIREKEIVPTLDFLQKLARATGVSMKTIIGFAFPDIAEEMGFDADTWLLARQFSDLPEDIRNLIKSLIAGKQRPRSGDKM